jgi:hypothetical protein
VSFYHHCYVESKESGKENPACQCQAGAADSLCACGWVVELENATMDVNISGVGSLAEMLQGHYSGGLSDRNVHMMEVCVL